jgi:hypothetical protein
MSFLVAILAVVEGYYCGLDSGRLLVKKKAVVVVIGGDVLHGCL